MDPMIRSIFLSKDHTLRPFTTTTALGGIQLSTLEKTASIGLSVLVGSFTLLIGGVVAFYWITAKIKSSKIKKIHPIVQLNENENKNTIEGNDLAKFAQKEPTSLTKKVRFADEVGRDLAEVRTYEPVDVDSDLPEQTQPESTPGSIDLLFLQTLPTLSLIDQQKMLKQFTQPMPTADYPLSTNQRRYPPRASCDTVRFEHGQLVSAHPEKIDLFKEEEIIALHPAQSQNVDGLRVHLDDKRRIVIQQQAVRGCTAAAVSMLTYPKYKKIDVNYLRRTNLGDTRTMQAKIREFGLASHVTKLNLKQSKEKLLECIQKSLQTHGSAIVSIAGEIGGHVVVVDEISENRQTIRLRDPYHGWAISVTQEAFCQRLIEGETSDMLQISNS